MASAVSRHLDFADRGFENLKQGERFFTERALARVDDIEAAADRFGIHDFYRDETPPPDLFSHREVGKERETDPSLDHPLCRLDRLHLEHNIRHKACTAEETLGERPVARPLIEENQRAIGDLRQPSVPGPHRPGRGSADRNERIIAKTDRFNLRMVKRSGQADLRLTVKHHLQDLLGVASADIDHHAWMGDLEPLQHIREKVRADRQRGRDLKRPPAGGPKIMHGLAGLGNGLEELLRVRTQGPAGSGQPQTVLASLEERHAQRRFERFDPRAHGGLRDPQGVGGSAEPAERSDRKEGFNLTDLHVFYPSFLLLAVRDYSTGDPCKDFARLLFFIETIKTINLILFLSRANIEREERTISG